MARWSLLVLLIAGICDAWLSSRLPHKISDESDTLDCAVSELAWQYAKQLMPERGDFAEVYDALQLSLCPNVTGPVSRGRRPTPARSLASSVHTKIFVDANSGNDNNPGTQQLPVKTIWQGVLLARASGAKEREVVLRAGTYYVGSTLQLDQQDSGLSIVNYPGEEPIVSGGMPLSPTWQSTGTPPKAFVTFQPSENALENHVPVPAAPGANVTGALCLGKMGSWQQCSAACLAMTECTGYTWHNATQGGWALLCYVFTDGQYALTAQGGHVSGEKVVPPQIFVADVSSFGAGTFTQLFVDNQRAVRARHPNANPETSGIHTTPTGYFSYADAWANPAHTPPAAEVHILTPTRIDFPTFQIGIGGSVDQFEPPMSFWGTAHPPAGSTYLVPSGLTYPNGSFPNANWADPSTGVVHAFHYYYWGNWQFQVDAHDPETRQLAWTRGGFQEARGSQDGSTWYIENILELLDAPGEWYLDAERQLLYYAPNGTDVPPQEVVVPVRETVLSVLGSQQSPVRDVALRGLTFTHTQSTFLEGYEVPSGGDWSAHRGGTVFAEGVERFTVEDCLFTRPGGNALTLSNYMRHAVIRGNEFVWSGDSAIQLLGSAGNGTNASMNDASYGNYPLDTLIERNLAHEMGIWGKQCGAVYQGLAGRTTIRNNVFFNGPRAGVNINDGMCGGHHLEGNLMFNLVRETADHGPFNSWDRQPYLTTCNNGTLSYHQAQSNITRNFLICNYRSVWPIDHDDGSCYYLDTFNYMVYGGFKNYLGHSKIAHDNVYVIPSGLSPCVITIGQDTDDPLMTSGWGDQWWNNVCLTTEDPLVLGNCLQNKLNATIPYLRNNTYYIPGANFSVQCSGNFHSLQQWQSATGEDIGSQVLANTVPSVREIIGWGKALLGLK